MSNLATHGWQLVPFATDILEWAKAARDVATGLLDTEENDGWWRYGRTWFAGVDVLPTGTDGAICGVPLPPQVAGPLGVSDSAVTHLHLAQLSVVRPGYPIDDNSESPSAARFRRDRDAAHVDGLLPEGPNRRRHLREPHAVILGLPLNTCTAGASPLVVWEGSHEIMRRAFANRLRDVSAEDIGEVDITDVYQIARREVFATCRRIKVLARPGEAYFLHRLSLHGIAPWEEGARAPTEGRMIAYFRPELRDPSGWLLAP